MLGVVIAMISAQAEVPNEGKYIACAASEAMLLEPSGESVELIEEAVESSCYDYLHDSAVAIGLAAMSKENSALYASNPRFRRIADESFIRSMKGFGRDAVVRVVLRERANRQR